MALDPSSGRQPPSELRTMRNGDCSREPERRRSLQKAYMADVATGLPAHIIYGVVNGAMIPLRETQCQSDIRVM